MASKSSAEIKKQDQELDQDLDHEIDSEDDSEKSSVDLKQSVKKLLEKGRESGYITYEQLNRALPQDQVPSEQIEDAMAMLSDMGINIVENDESDADEDVEEVDESKSSSSAAAEDAGGRSDDPVRMYLKEMGSVELLSREGEIELAKRMEDGQEKKIRSLCESPLTYQALIRWREALENDEIYLRDIVNLESNDIEEEGAEGAESKQEVEAKEEVQEPVKEEKKKKTSATPEADSEEGAPDDQERESEEDEEDEDESHATIAELEEAFKPLIMESLAAIEKNYETYKKLQDQNIGVDHNLSKKDEKKLSDLTDELVKQVKNMRLNNNCY